MHLNSVTTQAVYLDLSGFVITRTFLPHLEMKILLILQTLAQHLFGACGGLFGNLLSLVSLSCRALNTCLTNSKACEYTSSSLVQPSSSEFHFMLMNYVTCEVMA